MPVACGCRPTVFASRLSRAIPDCLFQLVCPAQLDGANALPRPLIHPCMVNYVLEILDGDRAGEVLAVADRVLRIGRKPGNDLVLADEKTSGVHAEVVLEGDRHVLRDLGSTNGTFLDGKRLTEIVLTPGDIVTVGRLRVKFRAEGEAPVADAGELAVRRLDAGRLRGRGGSIGLLAAVLVIGLGAAGWFWWQGEQQNDGQGASTNKLALVVTGNKLAPEIGGCDAEAGWQLRTAGGAFQLHGQSHSGTGSFVAQRSEGNDADFAVLRSVDAVPVFALRTLTIAAYVSTQNGGQVALRTVLSSANEQVPFRFRTGTKVASVDSGWQRLEAVVAVPSGCDRLQVEIVAVLPSADAVVMVDDIAVTEAGSTQAFEAKLTESLQTAFGSGGALAVRSVDSDNPAIVLSILPDTTPAELTGLHRAELCGLSDLGATVACTTGERGFQIAATGVQSLQWVLPAEAAGGLLAAAGDGTFASVAPESEFTAQSVLLGDRLTRVLVRFAAPVVCRGKLGGGLYRLTTASADAELLLSFRAERQQASELVRQAKGARDEGRPGEALDHLRTVLQTLPMDTEVLGQASTLRAEILAKQSNTLAGLREDLEVASFFTTRGGFERVALGVDDLVQLYSERNLEDSQTPKALQNAARERLQKIDGQNHDQQRARLESLSKAFADSQQAGLSQLVKQYVDKHLPGKAGGPAPSGPARSGGEGGGGLNGSK